MTNIRVMLDLDKEGYLSDVKDWSVDVAKVLATSEKIDLTAQHWDVIEVLREFYQQTEMSPAMRPLVKLVRENIGPDQGNSIYLMGLFGPSPAKMAAKLAGLPRPTNCL